MHWQREHDEIKETIGQHLILLFVSKINLMPPLWTVAKVEIMKWTCKSKRKKKKICKLIWDDKMSWVGLSESIWWPMAGYALFSILYSLCVMACPCISGFLPKGASQLPLQELLWGCSPSPGGGLVARWGLPPGAPLHSWLRDPPPPPEKEEPLPGAPASV